MPTKHEWKQTIRNANISLFPDVATNGKEHIAGYTTARIGDINGRKEARLLRDRLVKNMRSDGWQTWTEPESRMGGSAYVDYAFGASRGV
jgi:hypothetical protein